MDGKRYPGMFGAGYNDGMLFEAQDFVPKQSIPFVVKKGKDAGEHLEGYDALAQKIASSVAFWIVQQTKGIDK